MALVLTYSLSRSSLNTSAFICVNVPQAPFCTCSNDLLIDFSNLLVLVTESISFCLQILQMCSVIYITLMYLQKVIGSSFLEEDACPLCYFIDVLQDEIFILVPEKSLSN